MAGSEYLNRARTFSEYASRSGQDLNNLYTASHSDMSHFPATTGLNYYSGNGHVTYPSTISYSPYSSPYYYNSTAGHSQLYMPVAPQPTMSYHVQPPPRSTNLPSQSRMLPNNVFQSPHATARHALAADYAVIDTEPQESVNEGNLKSEPLDPPLQGYPDAREFDDLMDEYVKELSPKKQDKALIHASRARNIKTVLVDKKTTTVESAQFRFWVKKMFTLQPNDPSVPVEKRKICHEGKPVAIREKLFKILVKAHMKCQHGGRDKTSTQVRRVYSWVPKELISRFVKSCPTCKLRRGMNRNSPNDPEPSPRTFNDQASPDDYSPVQSRRDSITTYALPQLIGTSVALRNQNRWMIHTDTVDDPTTSLPMTDAYSNLDSYRNNDYSSAPADMIHSPRTSRHISSVRTRYKDE